jgi:hypothetical protein
MFRRESRLCVLLKWLGIVLLLVAIGYLGTAVVVLYEQLMVMK